MGWPKKNETCRLYLERAPKTYLLVYVESQGSRGMTEYAGELMSYPNPEKPTLTHGYANLQKHIHSHCRRVQWDEMPLVWRRTLLLNEFMSPWVLPRLYENPYLMRGLWRAENLQSVRDKAEAFEDIRGETQEWLELYGSRSSRELNTWLRGGVDELEGEPIQCMTGGHMHNGPSVDMREQAVTVKKLDSLTTSAIWRQTKGYEQCE